MSESSESIETTCPVCSKPYDGIFCTACTTAPSEQDNFEEGSLGASDDAAEKPATAYLVDLVSNRKIPVSVPRCKAGRDDLNDIVITGDQSISRFHFVLTRENGQYHVQDNKSRHGTFLNGNQITGVETINDGDVLKVGVSLFWFVIESPVAAPTGAEPMPVDLTERPSGLPVLNAKDLPMQGELRMSKSAQRSGRMPDPALTATSDSIPAITPDSTLAEYLGIKPSHGSKFLGGAPQESQEKTIPPSHLDSTFVAPPPSSTKSDEESARLTQELELSPPPPPEEEGRFAADSAELEKISKKYNESEFERFASHVEGEALTNEMLLNPLQAEEKKSTEKSNRQSKPPKQATGAKAREASVEESSPAVEDTAVVQSESAVDVPSATIEKFADIIEETASQNDAVSEIERHNVEMTEELASVVKGGLEPSVGANQGDTGSADTEQVHDGQGNASGNGAKSVMSMVKESTPGTVPEWCNKYFAGEINQMSRELSDLNEQIRQTQQRIRDVENRVSQLKGLRNTLLTAEGDELIEACGKVLIFMGWRVKISDDDRQELKLDAEDHLSIARVVWTATQAERTHLGQLSISQTRYWCEMGAEPKGILIISRISDQAPTPLSQMDYNSELADYAARKNVCLMTTMQLLAIYRDIAVNNVNPETLRLAVSSTSGWLQGFNLDATAGGDQQEGGTNKFSSLLSAS
jgi:pSer/pThr/pTyr-binding forkhead associated (FHA) protein